MVRIGDIAKMAGVSTATVSRVLNKTVFVKEETRQKVMDAVNKSGYKPNLLAKGLRGKDGRMIGLLVPEIHHPTFSLIIKYVEQYAHKYRFNLLLGNTRSDPDLESDILDDMLSRNVNGVISLRVSKKSRIDTVLNSVNVPFVQIDRASEQSSAPFVITDNYQAGFLAADCFIKNGHRNIACITGPMDISVSEKRLKGFCDRLAKDGIKMPDSFVFAGDFTVDSGQKVGKNILEMKDSISAIWAQNDPMAIGVMNYLLRSKVSIPDEISVMGMDDIDLAAIYVPSLTTIRQPFEKMCDIAVRYIAQPEKERLSRMMLMPELVVRESVAVL